MRNQSYFTPVSFSAIVQRTLEDVVDAARDARARMTISSNGGSLATEVTPELLTVSNEAGGRQQLDAYQLRARCGELPRGHVDVRDAYSKSVPPLVGRIDLRR